LKAAIMAKVQVTRPDAMGISGVLPNAKYLDVATVTLIQSSPRPTQE
jgi:hypothetical protein